MAPVATHHGDRWQQGLDLQPILTGCLLPVLKRGVEKLARRLQPSVVFALLMGV